MVAHVVMACDAEFVFVTTSVFRRVLALDPALAGVAGDSATRRAQRRPPQRRRRRVVGHLRPLLRHGGAETALLYRPSNVLINDAPPSIHIATKPRI